MNSIKIKENSLYGEIKNGIPNQSSSSTFQNLNKTYIIKFVPEKSQFNDGYEEENI